LRLDFEGNKVKTGREREGGEFGLAPTSSAWVLIFTP